MSFLTRLLEQVPSLCAVCRDWGTQAVCIRCITRFSPAASRCQGCALQVPPGIERCGACLTAPPAFDCALAGVDYAYPWSGLVADFKFKASLELADVLAARMAQAFTQAGAPRPDVLLPVPLSTPRLKERGFNQAWELARRLGRQLRLPADAGLLLRMKDSPHQLSVPHAQRSANVRGAFAVEPLRRQELAGRSIAVVDDVMTTGATFSEIARVLKQAGAQRVDAWALARTPRPGQVL